jgi:membrane associated rhomboid family serine protease
MTLAKGRALPALKLDEASHVNGDPRPRILGTTQHRQACRSSRYDRSIMPGSATTDTSSEPRCYRHPGRETLLSCSTCERPICTSCMRQAAVGIRCPECAGGGGRSPVRKVRAPSFRTSARAGGIPITLTLIAINVIVFLGELSQGVALNGNPGGTIVGRGELTPGGVADGEWWRLVTSAFLHANLFHLLFNMWGLWWLGGALERYAGAPRMLAIYASSVLWGSAGALLWGAEIAHNGAATVGASGGVFGLMAALLVLERQRGVALLGGGLGLLLAVNLAFTFLYPGISIGGHLGGILGGAAAAFALSGFGRGSLAYGRIKPQIAATLTALGAAAVVLSFAVA